jgi:predicted HAD superfamily Cof-like phosphohydrolase
MSYQKDVAAFMTAGEQTINGQLSLEGDQANLYMNLISEEYQETLAAFKSNDMIEVADGLADMVWVIMGMCNSCGIDFDSVWQEVKASNMSKFPDGKAIKNEHGKIMKPESYFKPNIKKVLGLKE